MPLEITVVAVGVGVDEVQTPAGKLRRLILVDQQAGITIVVPFDETSAQNVAAQLAGRPAVQIARALPPHPPNGNGHPS